MKAIKIPVTGVIHTVDVPDSQTDIGGFLKACQKQVGGIIECAKPLLLYNASIMPPTACLLADEEGIMKRKPVNHIATQMYGLRGIVGDALIVNEVRTSSGRDINGFEDNIAERICEIMNNRFKKGVKHG